MANQQPYGEANGYYNNPAQAQNSYEQPPQYGAPPPAPPTNQYYEKPMFDQAFKLEKPKYNDLWAGILVWSQILELAPSARLKLTSTHSLPSSFWFALDSLPSLVSPSTAMVCLLLSCLHHGKLDSTANLLIDDNKGTYGNGIYGSSSRAGLNTNTIVLFAFVLAVAVVLSYAYVLLARTFPRAFIWITGVSALGTRRWKLY